LGLSVSFLDGLHTLYESLMDWFDSMDEFLIVENSHAFKPSQKLWSRSQPKKFADAQRVVKAGRLVVEHDIVGTGNAHKVITASGCEEQEQIIS
jgi:hypothetical protein